MHVPKGSGVGLSGCGALSARCRPVVQQGPRGMSVQARFRGGGGGGTCRPPAPATVGRWTEGIVGKIFDVRKSGANGTMKNGFSVPFWSHFFPSSFDPPQHTSRVLCLFPPHFPPFPSTSPRFPHFHPFSQPPNPGLVSW